MNECIKVFAYAPDGRRKRSQRGVVYGCFHHRACSSTQVNFPTFSDRMNNLETALN